MRQSEFKWGSFKVAIFVVPNSLFAFPKIARTNRVLEGAALHEEEVSDRLQRTSAAEKGETFHLPPHALVHPHCSERCGSRFGL